MLFCGVVKVNEVGISNLEFLWTVVVSGQLRVPSAQPAAVFGQLDSSSSFAAPPEVLRAATYEAVLTLLPLYQLNDS